MRHTTTRPLPLAAGRAELEARVDEPNGHLAVVNRELRCLNQRKDELLGMVAHDLRNPISAIEGYARLLIELPFAPEERRTILGDVVQLSRFMVCLLDDLVDLSASERGRILLRREEVDVAGLMRGVAATNRLQAERKGIELQVELAEPLGTVALDPARMTQVLNNLIGNAVKFSHPETTVTLAASITGDRLTVSVADQGLGIPADEIETIFQAFSRTSTRSTAGEKSTGLGLAICKRLVEAHQGTIAVESEPGRGTCFTVTLPRSAEERTGQGDAMPVPPVPEPRLARAV